MAKNFEGIVVISVQPVFGSDPNEPLTILQNIVDIPLRQAIFGGDPFHTDFLGF